MDIQKFEEMIIDYLDGNLSGVDKNSFEEALNSSEEYREIFKQYQSIRTVTGSDHDLDPSPEVLERISEQVHKTVKHEKKSIYKRWFKFPVLAPALAVAIIAMLWVSAGEDYLKNKNIIPATERSDSNEFRSDYKASAGKLNQMETVAQEEELPDKEIDKVESPGRSKSYAPDPVNKPAPFDGEKKKESYAQPAASDSMGNFARAPKEQKEEIKDVAKGIKSDDLITEKNEGFADMSAADRDNGQAAKPDNIPQAVVADSKELKSETTRGRTTIGQSLSRTSAATNAISPSKRVEITNGYRRELNEVVAMQYKGNCNESLVRSQKLLDADPEPSVSIKTDLYLTQGECYMELKQYDKALEIFEKAKELTPHKSHFFNIKIKEIYIIQQQK